LRSKYNAGPWRATPADNNERNDQALEVLWDDTRFDELVALTTDQRFGSARQMVVLGMGRSKQPEAVDVLVRHLDDPVVSGHAVKALGKVRDPRARAGLESMTADQRTWVRKAAEKALSRLRYGRHHTDGTAVVPWSWPNT